MASHLAGTAPRTPTATAPVRRPSADRDGLSRGQRRGVVGAIALLHVGAIYALLQVPAVREAVVEAAPLFVDLLAPPPPPAPPTPPPPPPPPLVRSPPPRVIAAPPQPADPTPAPFTVEAPPPEPAPAPMEPVVVEAPPAPPAPVPAPAPVVIPASAVQFLESPQPPEYPRASKRLSEAGTVMLRVFIDQRGQTAQVQVTRSSGYPRLDESALSAVRKWRFKPYTVNGQPTAGWAAIPVMFELEK